MAGSRYGWGLYLSWVVQSVSGMSFLSPRQAGSYDGSGLLGWVVSRDDVARRVQVL